MSLAFDCHIDYVVRVVKRRIGFVKCFATLFKKPLSFWTLYRFYIHPIFVNCLVVWNSLLDYQINELEKVFHFYLRFTALKIGKPMPHFSHNYSEICETSNILILYSSKRKSDFVFAGKLLNGLIDCDAFKNKFDYYVPPRQLCYNNRLFIIPIIKNNIVAK